MTSANLIVLALVAGAVLLLIGFSVAYDRKKRQARIDLAAMRGWSYTAGGGGRRRYLLEGQCEGGPWSLEAHTGGKNNPGHTMFKCPGAAAGGGVVFIGAPGLATFLQSGIGRTVGHWGLHLGQAMGASVAPMERLLESPVAVDTAGTAFGKEFSVLATDTSLAQRLLTERAKETLLAWQPKGRGAWRYRGASVLWSDEGLSVSWRTDAQDPEDMAAVAELGMTLVKESRGSGTW